MTHVCITGNEQNPISLEQRLERVLSAHPRVLCELRLDYLDFSPAAAFGFLARLPAEMAPRLVLCQRLKASGPHANGRCNWDVHTWQSWWRDVMALRPWFACDLDWIILDRLAGESLAWRGRFRTRHAFFSLHGTIDEVETSLPNLSASALEHGAGVKIASPVETAADLARMQRLAGSLAPVEFRTAVAMGAAGKAWRWSPLAGSLSYFAVDSGRATAPGQEEMAAVLPYLASRQRPELYLLLGDNPGNRHGEENWNRAFLRRGARRRYVNCATHDSPGPSWSQPMLQWMEGAGVRGASVTKPYKLSFGEGAVNTLQRVSEEWKLADTDGPAVLALLERHGVEKGARVVIAGGGGAARAAQAKLGASGYEAVLWTRGEGGRLGPRPDGEALISTWPGEFQEALVEALVLAGPSTFELVVDAQLSRPPQEAPLARWAAANSLPYLHGTRWWREQARLQDRIWFGPDRLGKAREEALALVPASKSETLRALAIAAAFGLPTEIHGPALNEDTEAFVQALERLGVSVDKDGGLWRVFPPAEIAAPEEPVPMSEGAAGLRILGALSVLMKGTLRLAAEESLRSRPQEELLAALGLGSGAGWPLEIPCGGALPASISLERSSQFATGFLIAGAAEIRKGRRESYELRLEGERRSLPYVTLTLELLREAGIGSSLSDDGTVRLELLERKSRLLFRIEKDASSLAFLEAYARRWGLASFFVGASRQGDSAFPQLLEGMLANPVVSLRDHPDLAPPLWAAAALLRARLEVRDCPQLRFKESQRSRLLVEAALALGAEAEERDDGFLADFSRRKPVREECFLRTGGDHRLAMAAGLLSTEEPLVAPDRRDCVRKSFPLFWQALSTLEEALP